MTSKCAAPSSRPAKPRFKPPTKAERYVVARLDEGHTARRIAQALRLSSAQIVQIRDKAARRGRYSLEAMDHLRRVWLANTPAAIDPNLLFHDDVRCCNALKNHCIETLSQLVDELNQSQGQLTRLRGFDPKKADFEIFWAAKSLILLGTTDQICPESRVVKTYPVSGVESML
jgi:hypothetical protein